MSIYLGNTEIGQIYLGNTEISEAYLGSTKVYEAGGGSGGGELSDYVQDGLIFHLDGIARGNTTGHWIDRIGNVDFTLDSGVTEGADCITCSNTNSKYARNATYANTEASVDSYTIECVFKEENNWSAGFNLFLPVSGICMSYSPNNSRFNRGVRGSSSSTKQWSTFIANKQIYNTVSINKSRCLHNGSSRNTGNNMYASLKTECVCGSINGKMYAVRIYNRKLTASEMLQNQKVDNIRFNLGLTLPDTI